ncbi:MAG TPA: thioesterase family protein [Miltoncostaea sp.]|nr:thioesterase family protein [Miltoncostaea sp.]
MSGRTPEAHSGATDRVPPFRFSAVSRVDVAETDLGAVVYYGRYVHHVDRAVIAYRRHVGIPPLGPDGHLFVVRRLELDYRAPARFDDEVEAFVRVTRLGGSSHEYAVRLERIGGGPPAHLADAVITVVGVGGFEAPRPTRMPASMRDAIAAFDQL